jgi:hypothetical protein
VQIFNIIIYLIFYDDIQKDRNLCIHHSLQLEIMKLFLVHIYKKTLVQEKKKCMNKYKRDTKLSIITYKKEFQNAHI